MGARGPGARSKQKRGSPAGPRLSRKRKRAWQAKGISQAEAVCRFIESLKITSGAHAGRKFKLRPWQRAIIEDWYKTDAKGKRIVRTGVFSAARKSGKTALTSAIALNHLVGASAEPRGQIVAAAADRDQSGLIFDELVAWIEGNPWIADRVNIKRHEKVIDDLETGSKFRSLSSDAKKSHGLSASVVILDELAQWGDGVGRRLYDALTTSTGARSQPLTVILSTQAENDFALLSQLIDYGQQVKQGIIKNPAFSLHLYTLADGEDIWNEANWYAASPALNDFRSLEEMREFAERARQMPSLQSTFENLYLNRRIAAEERWISKPLWDACAADIDPATLVGKRCFGGLDLASVRDLTSFDLFWPETGALLSWNWCAKESIAARCERDRVPYDAWARDGWIELTPGKATDKRAVALRLAELCALYQPEVIGFDKWGMAELQRVLDEEGLSLPLKEFRQGFVSLSPATKAFEERVLNRRLLHNRNPVLTWALSNVSLERDAASNQKPSKERSREKIDPIVAGIIAVGMAAQEPVPMQYDFSSDMVLLG